MSTVPKVEKSCYIQWPKGKFEFIIYIESKFRLWLEFLTLGFFFFFFLGYDSGNRWNLPATYSFHEVNSNFKSIPPCLRYLQTPMFMLLITFHNHMWCLFCSISAHVWNSPSVSISIQVWACTHTLCALDSLYVCAVQYCVCVCVCFRGDRMD